MKIKIYHVFTLVVAAIVMSSCGFTQRIESQRIPTAVNTINSVRLEELNLKHGTDYTIMANATGEATVIYKEQKRGTRIIIEEENGECKLISEYDANKEKWILKEFDGIARFGFLSNDYGQTFAHMLDPEYVVRNIAIYRLINFAKVKGGDGVIEPVVSTNVEQVGKDIIFKTTVTAKLIKLKTDAK